MSKLAIPILLFVAMISACSNRAQQREPLLPASGVSEEQRVVDGAARVVRSMRASGNFPSFDHYASHARGVLIFPSVLKAALVLGGEGGKGVLLAHYEDGSWSAPAFYGIGAGSVGLQLGYERASVVLFLMRDETLVSVIDHGLTTGAHASVAAGTVGKSGHAVGATTAPDVIQQVDVGGLFAGVSLDGAVVSARDRDDLHYYGLGASTTTIIVDRRFDQPGTQQLRAALAGHD